MIVKRSWPNLLGCIAAALTLASCECGDADVEESMNDQDDLLAADGLYLSTASESAARASRVLPNGPSENARAVLGEPPRPTDPPVPESDRDYGPNEAIDWIATIELPDGVVLPRSRIAAVFPPAWRAHNGRPTIYGRSAARWTFVDAADAPDTYDSLKLGWDLVPWDGGPISGESMQTWARAVETAARALAEGARVSMNRSPAAAAARARQLAAWKSEWELDVRVVLAAPAGRTYDGVAMWDALSSLGLQWGDGDLFHWENPHLDAGDDHLFSVGTGTPPGYFFPEEAVAGRLQADQGDAGDARLAGSRLRRRGAELPRALDSRRDHRPDGVHPREPDGGGARSVLEGLARCADARVGHRGAHDDGAAAAGVLRGGRHHAGDRRARARAGRRGGRAKWARTGARAHRRSGREERGAGARRGGGSGLVVQGSGPRAEVVPLSRAKTFEQRHRMNPRFASAGDKAALKAAIKREGEFVALYKVARERWLAGERDVVWPVGTYAMRWRHNVRCAEPPG